MTLLYSMLQTNQVATKCNRKYAQVEYKRQTPTVATQTPAIATPTPAIATPTPAIATATPTPAIATPTPTPAIATPTPTPAVVTPTPAVATPTPAVATPTPTPTPAVEVVDTVHGIIDDEIVEDMFNKPTMTIQMKTDYSSFRMNELRTICKEKGIPANGKKKDMISALNLLTHD
jgi:hypothetical protein